MRQRDNGCTKKYRRVAACRLSVNARLNLTVEECMVICADCDCTATWLVCAFNYTYQVLAWSDFLAKESVIDGWFTPTAYKFS